jgi:hypothetical protein
MLEMPKIRESASKGCYRVLPEHSFTKGGNMVPWMQKTNTDRMQESLQECVEPMEAMFSQVSALFESHYLQIAF